MPLNYDFNQIDDCSYEPTGINAQFGYNTLMADELAKLDRYKLGALQ